MQCKSMISTYFSDRNWYVAENCEYKQSFVCKANIAEVDPWNDAKDDRGDYLDCPPGWEVTGNPDQHTGKGMKVN